MFRLILFTTLLLWTGQGQRVPQGNWKIDPFVNKQLPTTQAPDTTTPPPVTVVNDQCSTAIPLELGEILAGSTVGATADVESNSKTCGTANPRDSSPGVWYKIVGTGGPLTVTTCTGDSTLDDVFDSQMLVFTGDCDDLTCIAGNDDAYDDICGTAAGVTFSSIAEVNYYVLVYSYSSSASAMGTFGVTAFVEEPDPTPAPTPRPEVLNDNCIAAIPLEIGQVITSSTVGATVDTESSTNVCGSAVASDSSPGVWFVVEGNGGPITVTTCTGNSSLDGFDSQILVFTGYCGNLTCIAGNDVDLYDTCYSYEAGVTFSSVEGTDYYVLVYGYASFSTGTFGVTALSVPETPNDNCTTVLPLEIGQVIASSTVGATVDTESSANVCGSALASDSSPGVWFVVEGNGDPITVTTCTGNSTLDGFDSQMLVYSGDCGNLTCIAGNDDVLDDFCYSGEAGVTFPSDKGTKYYVLVYGYYLFSSGTFGVTALIGPELPANDNCIAAMPLETGQVIASSTVGATVDTESSTNVCGSAVASDSSPGVWFVVEGNGGPITVTTCTGNSSLDGFDSQILVYSGDCGNLTCIAGNSIDWDDACYSGEAGVTFSSVEGTYYYVLVYGYSPFSTGTFGVTALSVPETPNDNCIAALPLEIGKVIASSTIGATVDPESSADFCGSALASDSSPGVWFVVEGNGDPITVTTCTGNSTLDGFDSQMLVYAGDCGNLTCIAGNDDVLDDFCYSGEAGVTFPSVEGTDYFVLVYGYYSFSSGTFGITALVGPEPDPTPAPTHRPEVLNDNCTSASPLELGAILAGSSYGATADLESSTNTCGGAESRASSPGVWYKVVGPGGLLTVTTCTGDSTLDGFFDSQMLVYIGSCGNLTCIAGNDDEIGGSCGTEAGVTFSSIAGVDYYVLVYSYSTLESATGSFGITAFQGDGSEPPPENDDCSSASLLEVGEVLAGSTAGATVDSVPTYCGEASQVSSPGVWYYLIGEGIKVTVTTCVGNSTLEGNFDSQMLVFSGSCGNLTCVGGNHYVAGDSCGLEAGVNFFAEGGVDYFVLVYGYADIDTGIFGITVMTEPEPGSEAPSEQLSSTIADAVGRVGDPPP